MAIDLSKINADLQSYGITDVKEIYYNPSFEELFNHEMDPDLEGFEKGQLSELGAVNVMTGIFTGRSPKDKYIVMDDTTKDNVWWAHPANRSDNKPVDEQVWKHCYKLGSQAANREKALCGGWIMPEQMLIPACACALSWKWRGRLIL